MRYRPGRQPGVVGQPRSVGREQREHRAPRHVRLDHGLELAAGPGAAAATGTGVVSTVPEDAGHHRGHVPRRAVRQHLEHALREQHVVDPLAPRRACRCGIGDEPKSRNPEMSARKGSRVAVAAASVSVAAAGGGWRRRRWRRRWWLYNQHRKSNVRMSKKDETALCAASESPVQPRFSRCGQSVGMSIR